MKRISPILVLAMLGSWAAAAQDSATMQGGASAQSQTSAKGGKSGAQASNRESASGSASASEGNDWEGISEGSKIEATLADSLDAKKNKPGDRVEARTTEDLKEGGKVVFKRGTRLVGHVTQAQARAKEQSQSQLGIMFDHAVLKDGREVPFNATVQALAMAQSSTMDTTGADNMMASGSGMGSASGNMRGGGLMSGVASTTGATAGSVTNAAGSAPANVAGATNMAAHSTGAVGGLTSDGRLISNSSGVFGLQGLAIDSAASSAAQSSMIVSSTRNVHLDSGTQMLLSASSQAK